MASRSLAIAVSVALAAPLTGCYSIKHYVDDSGTPVETTSSGGSVRYHFKEEGRYYYLLYGLLPVWSDKTETLLGKHTVPGTKVANLKITQQFGPMDILLTVGVGILGGVYLGFVTRSVAYEGDVVNDLEAAN